MNKYEKRKQKREEKKNKIIGQYQSYENIYRPAALYKAAFKSAKGVMFKASVQKFLLNLFRNIYNAHQDLINGVNVTKGFIKFIVIERGKRREISSVKIIERFIQKDACTEVLYPVLTHNLITDNGASQKGKGTLFAQQRLVKHLCQYYKRYGKEGYVLTIDFKNYFGSVPHKQLKNLLSKHLKDYRVVKLANDFIDAFDKEKGLGLGSETSQIFAICYVNEIDHFIKDILGVKAYGRYMDDSYIIHHDKNALKGILSRLNFYFEKYGIEINKKKTCIRKLSQGFTFLKTRFYLSESGKIIKKPCRQSITRERRKIKKHYKHYLAGDLTMETINQSYKSWLGSMKRRTARKSVYNTKLLYNSLFMKGENENGK